MPLSFTNISELLAIHGTKSLEYQQGIEAALKFRFDGDPIECPFPAATAQADAFHAGVEEGHATWWQLKRRLSGNPINLAILDTPDEPSPSPAHKRKRAPSMPFFGGFRFGEVRQMVIDLRLNGIPYTDIAARIKARWPKNPRRHVTRSAIQRFWTKARDGKLKHHGIDLTARQDKEGAQ